jgi:hypothetical protein
LSPCSRRRAAAPKARTSAPRQGPSALPSHWQINYNGGAAHETITFMNSAAIDSSDWMFA